MAEPYTTTIEIDAPPDEVFRYLTEADAMTRWMGQYAVLEPWPDGRFEIDINGVPIRGRYLSLDPPHAVTVSWGTAGNEVCPPGATTVEFRLTATAAGTRLELVHRDLPETRRPAFVKGWVHYLARLAATASGHGPQPDPWAHDHVEGVR